MKTRTIHNPGTKARYAKFLKEGISMQILIKWDKDHTQARVVDVVPLNETEGGEL
jgi:hypothetical protein